MDPISFDPGNGQLEVVPQFFANQAVTPFDITWAVAVGAVVHAGQVLGEWQFAHLATIDTDIVCPADADGRTLQSFNDATDFNQLDQVPAQVLAFFV
jgi:hypothetical protein